MAKGGVKMIELINITKKIDERVLFENLNLKIADGSFSILTGVSGSGKSTLLNIIGGLDYNFEGDVLINNKVASNKNRLKKFDFLFQNYGLIESETIKYNLKLVKKADEEKYIELLQLVRLNADLNQYVYTLSGGEQQRLALARLLLSNRKIILADEPTASLDIKNRDYIIEMLITLNNHGKTIFLVSHDEAILNKLSKSYNIYRIEDSQLKPQQSYF